MKKYNTLEEMEDIFIDRGFVIDCFDAYSRHQSFMMHMMVNTVLFICTIAMLCSFFFINFTWGRLGAIVGFYIVSKAFFTLLFYRMLHATEEFTINAKKRSGNYALQQYYAHYDRMTDEDKKQIFTQFVASRIGLSVYYK